MSGSPGGSESSYRGKDPMQYSDDEDEGKEGYKVGGYHAVKVGLEHFHTIPVSDAGYVMGRPSNQMTFGECLPPCCESH